MKTTIVEDKSEPVAPVRWPKLYRYVKNTESLGEIAMLFEDGSGVTVVSATPEYPFGHRYPKGSRDDTDFRCAWQPITAPITITFDPTK